MLLANRTVAEFIGKVKGGNPKTFVYRVHDEPDPERMENLQNFVAKFGYKLKATGDPVEMAKSMNKMLSEVKGKKEQELIETISIRSMQKACYTTENIGHYGLAFKFYTHFTSPIRRYPDLIVHRMLRRYYFEEDFSHRKADEEKVKKYAVSSSEREREADAAEYECEDMKKAEYMKDKVGMVFEGIITSVKNYGFYVTLPDTIEGIVRVDSLYDGYYRYDDGRMALINDRTKTMYRIGEKISVRVLSASKETRTIEFGVIRSGGGKIREKTEPVNKGRKTRSRAARKAEQYGYELKKETRGRKRSASGRKQNGRSKKR